MTLEALLEDRNRWQDKTVERMREKLLLKPEGFLRTGKSEKLVAVYGLPQTGKTTLILKLMGIKQEYQQHVYQVLRAGIAKGNSSTSTAIIYQRMPKEEEVRFGISYQDGPDCHEKINYFEEEAFIEEIEKIRKEVESDQRDKNILYFYIPQKYFDKENSQYSNINILDLPGDGSRNEGEKDHVNGLIEKYTRLASVTIVACAGNHIQDLETFEFPTGVSWRKLNSKYMVVLTRTFSDSTIKGYFKREKRKDALHFLNFVKAEFRKALSDKKILPEDFEFFPIELGDSLGTLLKELTCDEDRKIVNDAVEYVAGEIKEAIQKRKGNDLKAAIQDLRNRVHDICENDRKKLTESLNEIDNDIKRLEEELENSRKTLENNRELMEALEEKHKDYEEINRISCEVYIGERYTKILNYLNARLTYDGKKLKDKNKEVLKYCEDCFQQFVIEIVEQYREKHGFFEHIDAEEIFSKITYEEQVFASLDKELYPTGLFAKKTEYDKCETAISDAYWVYKRALQNYLRKEKNKKKKRLEKENQKYDENRLLLLSLENVIAKSKKEIEEKSENKNQLQNKIDMLERNKEADIQHLNDYLAVAKKEYLEQKNNILKKIDSVSLCVEEKTMYLIFLLMLERDYVKITES